MKYIVNNPLNAHKEHNITRKQKEIHKFYKNDAIKHIWHKEITKQYPRSKCK